MFKLRLAILGAAAALAMGTVGALAMQETSGAGDPDAHGDAVAAAAQSCPHGAGGVHGACVSAIASTEGRENQEAAQTSSRAQACKAADAAENAAEKAPAKGDKAARAVDRTEDKAEHKAFAACVSGKSASTAGS